MLTEVEEKRTRHGLIQRRCGHELRTRSSEGRGQVAKANLLIGWDSLLGVTRGKADSSSYKCVCSSNRGPSVPVMTQQFGQIMQLKAKD